MMEKKKKHEQFGIHQKTLSEEQLGFPQNQYILKSI